MCIRNLPVQWLTKLHALNLPDGRKKYDYRYVSLNSDSRRFGVAQEVLSPPEVISAKRTHTAGLVMV